MTQRVVKMPEPGLSKLQSESIFRALVEAVNDYAIFVLDPKGHIVTWNPGAQRIKGYKAEEIIGKHFSIFYPPEDLARDKPGKELQIAAKAGRLEDEGWRLRKDGRRFWASVVITRITDDSGKILGFGKITRDLTERRRTEQMYRMLVDGVTDYAIYSIDPQGRVTSWNSGAERTKGYKAEEIIGRHFSIFYTPEEIVAGMPDRTLNIARERGHFEDEGWRVRKDGTRFWSTVAVTPLKDEQGDLAGFSKITRDITYRKNLMDQVKRHTEELELRIAERERTNAELEAFSYSVSHDLRAPLRAIEGFSQALMEEYSHLFDDTAKDYLEQVIGASTRMNRLVQDLLNYSRLSRTELALDTVDLDAVLAAALKELSAKERSSVSIANHRRARVLAHEPTLVQVLGNLISNALKFHVPEQPPQVTINIGTGTRQKTVKVSVTDRGIGIAPEHQERIFQVFERLHGIEDFPGTGIGLAIVKRGTERMEGRYGLESSLGKGSTFWIELREAEESK
jgi:PAS domain S-box-containing protein